MSETLSHNVTAAAMRDVLARLDRAILATPSGDVRNELCDAALILRASTPASPAAAQGGAWMPIETAPKDDRILVWPYWSDGKPAEVQWRFMKRGPGRWETPGGLVAHGAEPTVWQPLPSPPGASPTAGPAAESALAEIKAILDKYEIGLPGSIDGGKTFSDVRPLAQRVEIACMAARDTEEVDALKARLDRLEAAARPVVEFLNQTEASDTEEGVRCDDKEIVLSWSTMTYGDLRDLRSGLAGADAEGGT